MWKEIGAKFRHLSKNKNLRCIIIRGKGGKSFSPGNDISEFKTQRSNSRQAKEYGKYLHGTLSSILNCPIPVIALIEGICVGGGLEIAACCDIRICGISSKFGVPINRLGLTMAPREMKPFIQLVGKSIALEILLEGRVFDSNEAFQKGLVNKVVPVSELEAETVSWAREILRHSPMALRLLKAGLNAADDGLAGVQQLAGDATLLFYLTEEGQEGRNAYQEKREPNFGKFPKRP